MQLDISTIQVRMPQVLLAFLAVVALVAGSYYLWFGWHLGLPVAQTPGKWADFGSYVGGVLGSMFSGLAFIAAMWAGSIQSLQLRSIRSQAELEEIQRVIAAGASTIDRILERESGAKKKHIGPEMITPPRTVRDAFNRYQSTVVAEDTESDGNPRVLMARTTMLDVIEESAPNLSDEINQLASLCLEYKRKGGSTIVLSYYRSRYASVVELMHKFNLLNSPTSYTLDFFNPGQFAPQPIF